MDIACTIWNKLLKTVRIMWMDKILTITVPSYNVEKFLDQTLKSFVSENIMENLEVLIVDDGSCDNTVKIGEEYAKQYPATFRVISKENGGHGSTINCGIREAKGKYFKVVDGDDWVSTEGLEKLIYKLEECNADYVFTNFYRVNDVTKKKTKVYFPEIPTEQELSFSSIEKETRISMHALVIKTDILRQNDIYIDEHSFYVDVEYILYPIPYVKSVIYYDIFVYMYRLAQEEQSVSMKGYRRHMQNHIDVILHILDYIHSYKEKKESDNAKIYFMEKRIAEMIDTQGSIYASFPLCDKKRKEQFKEFDILMKRKNTQVYGMADSGMLRTLRKTRFHFYALIILLSRLRNWKTQQRRE